MVEFIDIQVTNICNRTCPWCPPYKLGQIYEEKLIDFDIINKLVMSINNDRHLFGDNLLIKIGRFGEPLLNFDYVYSVAKFLKDNINMSFKLQLNTNGDCLNKIDIRLLNIFDMVFISRYNVNEEYNQALINIFNIFHINSMPYHNKSKKTCSFFYNNTLIKYRYQYNTVMYATTRGGMLSFEDNEINFIRKNIRDNMCDIIGRFLTIDSNGECFPCCELTSMISQHKSMSCGNLKLLTISQILNKINKLTFNSICKTCTATIRDFIE